MNYKTLLNQNPVFATLQRLADKQSLATYVVGGFVRDLLLGKIAKDIDIVCVGNGISLAQAFAHTIGTSVTVFKNFGTAMVAWQDWQIEFVGARKESYTTHSRKPSIATGSLTDDLSRRDFTINALAICLNQAQFGTLIDLFEGIKDLTHKIIQTPLPPNRTFSDDPLRMLRAIRFASQLSFTLTPNLHTAIRQEAQRLSIVSKERISTEFNKILLSNQPAKSINLLDQTSLLKLILPEIEALKGVECINGHSHKDNFKHTLQVLTNVSRVSDNLWLRWAALLHDIAKPRTKHFNPKTGFSFHGHEDLGARMVPHIFRKMRLPLNNKMRYVQKLVRLHLRPIALSQKVTHSAIRRLIYEASDTLDDLMHLCRADITSNSTQKVQQYLKNFDQVEAKIQQVKQKDHITNLQPVINGNMIMQTYGLKPCKQVGTIKKALKEAILEGIIPNKYPQLHTYMLQLGKKQGLSPITPLPH